MEISMTAQQVMFNAQNQLKYCIRLKQYKTV